jgi:hypothetical protein
MRARPGDNLLATSPARSRRVDKRWWLSCVAAVARAHDRKQQLKKQKAKTKRTEARRKSNARALPSNLKALVARAVESPFGPCWVSSALDDEVDGEAAALVSVIVTRRLGGLLLPCIVLVDRTCLGVKNAFVAPLQTELDVERLVMDMSASGDPLRPAELVLAQSVVFHAIDYARSLGFEPHRDFVAGLIGDRPAVLLDTPFCRPERPLYVAGPHDNVNAIVSRLAASVGPNGYDLVHGLGALLDGSDDLDSDDEPFDDEPFDDDDVLTVEGVEAPSDAPELPR